MVASKSTSEKTRGGHSELVGAVVVPLSEAEEVYRALVLGTRDYVTKNGFRDVVIGLSGGIDSSLVATIATHSNLLVMEEPDRAGLLAQARDFLRAQPETGTGEFVLPMVTAVLRATRNPR